MKSESDYIPFCMWTLAFMLSYNLSILVLSYNCLALNYIFPLLPNLTPFFFLFYHCCYWEFCQLHFLFNNCWTLFLSFNKLYIFDLYSLIIVVHFLSIRLLLYLALQFSLCVYSYISNQLLLISTNCWVFYWHISLLLISFCWEE